MIETNKAIRVLSGEKLKYSHRIILLDGKELEFQSAESIKVEYNDQTRSLWLCYHGYGGAPIMPYQDGMIVLTEENPK